MRAEDVQPLETDPYDPNDGDGWNGYWDSVRVVKSIQESRPTQTAQQSGRPLHGECLGGGMLGLYRDPCCIDLKALKMHKSP